ncbi:hypothetical protein EI16_05170 [Hydrogenovibrio marinus]|uniref:DUF5610 domain-containing protein n=2 Tax=Hydrogenovibrio marinus TaxID=28885 RepID=A0A067A049_HYDMR|nr:hypothetical protein EI16_05170 [Hydrogenovibrio marinus]BBN58830.1 hypothetical protein HVMH_0424 [Hydrogenovibrio marinus]
MPSSESVSDLLGQSGRAATVLSELLKNRQDHEDANNKNKSGFPVSSLLDSFSPSKALQQASYASSAQTQYAYSNTMTLNLTTKEGDQVSVDFRQLYAEYKSYQTQQSVKSGPSGARYFESTQAMESTAFEERFGFSVKGDLNDNEMKAIFDVFQQVDNLANHFFKGDIEKAFKKAVDLNVDFGQLQSVSVNLQQTQTYAASYQQAAAYQQQGSSDVASANGATPGSSVVALPAYLQKMQNVVDTLSQQFDNARQIAEKMLADVVASRFPEEGTQSIILQRLQDLHDALINRVPLSETTLKPSGIVINPNKETATDAVNTTPATNQDVSVA